MQKLYLGCGGWYYPDWHEVLYGDLKKKDWFSQYAAEFNTVEINNPFYRSIKEDTVKTWYKQAPKNFTYSVKAHRYITHYKHFVVASDSINRYYNTFSLLKEKLDCILFQLPPNMHYSPEKLALIIASLNYDYDNVIEFRHLSWWNDAVY